MTEKEEERYQALVENKAIPIDCLGPNLEVASAPKRRELLRLRAEGFHADVCDELAQADFCVSRVALRRLADELRRFIIEAEVSDEQSAYDRPAL